MIGALLIFIDLVITSHISLELANTVWPKLETCVISQCFDCQSAALISFSHCLAITIRFEIFRSHTLKWINIIVLRTLRRKNYSCGLQHVMYLSICPFHLCYLGYLENCVYFHIVFFALSGWFSTWNSWICGSLYWCYWQAEECSFSSENLNCSLPDSLLQRGERVKSAGFLILCLSCRFVRNSLINLFSSKLKLNSVAY